MSLPNELVLTLSGISLLTTITLFTHLIRRMKSVESRISHVEETPRPLSVVVPQQQPPYIPYGYPTAPPLQVSI